MVMVMVMVMVVMVVAVLGMVIMSVMVTEKKIYSCDYQQKN